MLEVKQVTVLSGEVDGYTDNDTVFQATVGNIEVSGILEAMKGKNVRIIIEEIVPIQLNG